MRCCTWCVTSRMLLGSGLLIEAALLSGPSIFYLQLASIFTKPTSIDFRVCLVTHFWVNMFGLSPTKRVFFILIEWILKAGKKPRRSMRTPDRGLNLEVDSDSPSMAAKVSILREYALVSIEYSSKSIRLLLTQKRHCQPTQTRKGHDGLRIHFSSPPRWQPQAFSSQASFRSSSVSSVQSHFPGRRALSQCSTSAVLAADHKIK